MALLALLTVAVYAGPALSAFNSLRLGTPGDSTEFQYFLGWNVHALAHFQNPFFTHSVFAPDGLHLATVASIPSVSILVAPVTLLIGSTAAYNTALLLGIASSAAAMYLLAREMFSNAVAALLVGALMVVSPYEAEHGLGHLNLVWIGGLPFVAYLTVRLFKGTVSRRWYVLGTAVAVAFTIGASTELFVTGSLFGAIALLIAHLLSSDADRVALRACLLPLALGVLVGLLLASPAIWAALTTGLPSEGLNGPGAFSSDLTNLVLPAGAAPGSSYVASISRLWIGNQAENTAYLPVTLLALVVIAVVCARGHRVARGILIFIGTAVILSFGPSLTIAGHRVLVWPGIILAALPVTRFALPGRFSAYVFMGAVLLVAYAWSSGRIRRAWVLGLSVGTFVLLYPSFGGLGVPVDTRPAAYVSSGQLAREHGGESILVLPPGQYGPGLIWETDTNFAFRMPTGPCCGATFPPQYRDPTAAALYSLPHGFDWARALPPYLTRVGVTTVLVDPSAHDWLQIMRRAFPGKGRVVGGVWVFDLTSAPGRPLS
ncbi:hypothetical protein [Nocardioides baekrokdamisoli]|nr:hypothetical protein [Nocardioides baekrokdamisoli]